MQIGLFVEFLLIIFALVFLIFDIRSYAKTVNANVERAYIGDDFEICEAGNSILPLNLFVMTNSKKCEWYSQRSTVKMYQSLDMGKRSISVSTHINPEANDEAVIFVSGGPAGLILFYQDTQDDPTVAILSKHYRYVYKIGYSGTSFNMIIDNVGQLGLTNFEIFSLASKIKDKLGSGPDLVGVSMGAPIAASAFTSPYQNNRKVLSNLILLHPLICSPEGVIKFFDRTLGIGDDRNGRNEKKLSVVVVDNQFGRAVRNDSFDARYLISKFFGPVNQKNDLAHYLDKLSIKPKIVMGSLDKKIYCGDEAYLKAFTAKYPTTIIPGMDHFPTNSDQLSQVMKAIE